MKAHTEYCHKNEQGDIYGEKLGTGEGFKSGDVCKMELNTKEKTFEIFLNDKSLGIAFNDIEFDDGKTYNLAISLCANSEADACIEIIAFGQRYR